MNLDARSLLEEAAHRTGLSDFGPEDFIEPYNLLIQCLNKEAEIAQDRLEQLKERLVRLLVNRLHFADDVSRHPEILDEDLGTPIVITSLPRTGSTKLHRMLAASGDFNHLDFWHVHMPSRILGDIDQDIAARRAETQRHEDWMYRISPDILTGHPQFTYEAEECQWLMEQSFRYVIFFGLFEVPSFLGSLIQADPDPAYDYYKTQLQHNSHPELDIKSKGLHPQWSF